MIRLTRYTQNRLDFIACNMSFQDLDSTSHVLIYDEHERGYQRAPNTLHVNRIKKYILNNINSFKLPTSVILAIDKNQLAEFIVKNGNEEFIDISKISSALFRVVDGQHRILGMKKALESLNESAEREKLKTFLFNIVCLITEPNNRSVELEIFVDINSKGKRVSTDLAELAKYDYQIYEEKLPKNSIEASEHIAMKASRSLRENRSNSVWNYAIKFDIHSNINLGIIGVSSFRKSITYIVDEILPKKDYKALVSDKKKTIQDFAQQAEPVVDFLTYCWDDVVKSKWPNCFEERRVQNEQEEFVTIHYSADYYLQKAMGVKAINGLILETLKHSSNKETAKEQFANLIKSSQVYSSHWKAGGVFSGLNSESGFKKIRQVIKNEITLSN